MSPFLASILWFFVFIAITRTISVIGGKKSRYLKSTFNQDFMISIVLTVLVVFVMK